MTERITEERLKQWWICAPEQPGVRELITEVRQLRKERDEAKRIAVELGDTLDDQDYGITQTNCHDDITHRYRQELEGKAS